MKVKKAIVLAAGMGTRLRPLTASVPKPLMTVWGERMIDRIVTMLRDWGVEEIAVNAHYLSDQIVKWCEENDCRVSVENEILGTGGFVNPLRSWIGSDDFYVVNSDIVLEGAMPLEFRGDEIGAALVTDEGPKTIEIEPESSFVTCWHSPDPGWYDNATYAGLALLKNEILEYFPQEGSFSLISVYEKAMMDGKFIRAVKNFDLLWSDAGTIDSYISLNEDGEDNAFGEIPHIKALGATGLKFLCHRGSERMFFKANEGIVCIYDDAERKENAKFVSHAAFLKENGIGVPEIYKEDKSFKSFLMEDVGKENVSFERYVRVIEELVKFNSLDAPSLDLEPPMDEKMWKWERELFVEHCLKGRFNRELPTEVLLELEKVAEILEKEPKALVHRDFQSTNVLWKGDKLSFIDFQGMRSGPAVYDLASLVYDPYVKLSKDQRRALIGLYAERVGRKEIIDILPFAAVERLIQCLGAYGRLVSVGKTEFDKFVKPALENLLEVADSANLEAISTLAEDLLNA